MGTVDQLSKTRAAPATKSSLSSCLTAFSSMPYILRLAWDFTESNFNTFVLPNTAFGVAGALSGTYMLTGSTPSFLDICHRLPIVVGFNWYSVLIFDLANQKSPESIREDSINKPWRPIPTGKVTAKQTQRSMLVAIPIVLALNYLLGVWKQGVFILILTWLYNDLRGSDELIRDLIIAIAYGLFNHASLQLALVGQAVISDYAVLWICVVSGVVLTTMQVQDLKDQAGDRTRGRKTIALAFGDKFSRWMIAVFVMFWSFICPWFWNSSGFAYTIPVLLGAWIAVCATTKMAAAEDARTWKLWCLWQACLYCLPVVRRLEEIYL